MEVQVVGVGIEVGDKQVLGVSGPMLLLQGIDVGRHAEKSRLVFFEFGFEKHVVWRVWVHGARVHL